MTTPDRAEQVIRMHAPLIVETVKACQEPSRRPALEQNLSRIAQIGHTDLVAVLRRILDGAREVSLLGGLEEDDAIIVEAVLRGLQNPATLPEPEVRPDPTAAAPGLAQMIHLAGRGNPQALQLVATMAEQMTGVGGRMAQVGGVMRRLVNGERDPDRLCERMDAEARSLVLKILEELARLADH